MAFFKLIRILFIFLRFRLDDLLPKESLPLWIKIIFFLSPFRIIPTSKSPGVRLAEALELAGPLFVKFGQILSTRPDFLTPDLIQELKKFQNNLKPFPVSEAINTIEKDLGKPIEELFEWFNEEPLAAASIAQVHEAKFYLQVGKQSRRKKKQRKAEETSAARGRDVSWKNGGIRSPGTESRGSDFIE